MVTTNEASYEDKTRLSPLSGSSISIIYGSCYLSLLLILIITIYCDTKKSNRKLSFKKLFRSVWKKRGIYAPIIIHIYDTATDIGVLYEWYILSEIEKNGTNLKSLDMQQFLWIALGFMIAYRAFAVIYGVIVVLFLYLADSWDDNILVHELDSGCCVITKLLFAIIFGLLELTIFGSMYLDYKLCQKRSVRFAQAGKYQRMAQFIESILESLPEVILQSVFVMRAANDPILDKAAGDIKILVFLSIFASILSITTKYLWADADMVIRNAKYILIAEKYKDTPLKCRNNTKHCMIKQNVSVPICYSCNTHTYDEKFGHQCYKCSKGCDCYICLRCYESAKITKQNYQCNQDKKHQMFLFRKKECYKCHQYQYTEVYECESNYCYFYRICAECYHNIEHLCDSHVIECCSCVGSVYFSYGYIIRAIWRLSAVLSRFVIFALIWVVLGGMFEVILIPLMTIIWYLLQFVISMALNWNSTVKSYIYSCDWRNGCDWKKCCKTVCIHIIVTPLTLAVTGLFYQMGIVWKSDRLLYFIRVFENVILMSVICVFAFKKFDCKYCSDKDERSAFNNERILLWIIVGWIAIIVHCVTSHLMDGVINDTKHKRRKQISEKSSMQNSKLHNKQILDDLSSNIDPESDVNISKRTDPTSSELKIESTATHLDAQQGINESKLKRERGNDAYNNKHENKYGNGADEDCLDTDASICQYQSDIPVPFQQISENSADEQTIKIQSNERVAFV